MPDLAPNDRLQPSLLDRLMIDPSERGKGGGRQVLSMRKLRECVLRDLTWLLNADSLEQTQDLESFPEVRASTVNYGVRDLAGAVINQSVVSRFEQEIRQAIINFEPRILASTLRVRALLDENRMDHRSLSFEIHGELWADPEPLSVFLKTQVNVETGEALVSEMDSSVV